MAQAGVPITNTLFPPPPGYYKAYTPENVARLAELRGSDDNDADGSDSAGSGSYDGTDSDVYCRPGASSVSGASSNSSSGGADSGSSNLMDDACKPSPAQALLLRQAALGHMVNHASSAAPGGRGASLAFDVASLALPAGGSLPAHGWPAPPRAPGW